MLDKMIPVESSNVKEIGYDAPSEILAVHFHSGGRYWYFEVPKEVFFGFDDAESIGKYFNAVVKGAFACLKVTDFEQDVVFEAVEKANARNVGTPQYRKHHDLCRLMDWDAADAWDKMIGRKRWFDHQNQTYKDDVFSLMERLLEKPLIEWPGICAEEQRATALKAENAVGVDPEEEAEDG